MTSPISHEVTISKEAARALNADKIQKQTDSIVASVNTKQRTDRGWNVRYKSAPGGYTRFYSIKHNGTGNDATYSVVFMVTCEKERPTTPSELANIIAAIDKRGGLPGWKVTAMDGKPYVAPEVRNAEREASDIGYSPITIPSQSEWESNFSHLYGLDAHIGRIRRALDAAVLSNWQHRFHCALIGPPGCGKSDICGSLKRALGDEAVMEFDATSTTMAGAQKELGEREELPRVIVVEEIEKAPDASMQWLLSVLDLRGEIRKTTARGNILRDARMLAIATVNDLPTFQKVAFGALQSRFSNKVFFNRPSRELLSRILLREIERINGNPAWVQPALDYAMEIDTTDPREIIAITLCGRDGLLDGSYQNDMRATRNTSGVR